MPVKDLLSLTESRLSIMTSIHFHPDNSCVSSGWQETHQGCGRAPQMKPWAFMVSLFRYFFVTEVL